MYGVHYVVFYCIIMYFVVLLGACSVQQVVWCLSSVHCIVTIFYVRCVLILVFFRGEFVVFFFYFTRADAYVWQVVLSVCSFIFPGVLAYLHLNSRGGKSRIPHSVRNIILMYPSKRII